MGILPLLALVLLASSARAGFPACVTKGRSGGYAEPPALAALLRCQEKARESYRSAGGSKWDRLDDFQRSEVRQYLVRHPDRADTGPAEASKALREAAEQEKRALKAGRANAARLDPARASAQGGLEKKLWEMSDSGKAGPKLSDDSALRLKDAARDAKAQGLDLGVGGDIEKWLLDPRTDPKAASSGPPLD